MKIEKWSGIVTAASPYALPSEAMVEQHNLQVRKPGQLTPRPGMTFVIDGVGAAPLSMHRLSPGSTAPDRVLTFGLDAILSGTTFQHLLSSVTLNTQTNTLTSTGIYAVDASTTLRPSFAQDRHGTVYLFLGNGVQPRTYRYSINPNATVEFGLPAPTVAPTVAPSGDGWFIERVDVLSSGTSYYTPPTLTVVKATNDTPAREAKVRAVVQGGQIVAVDIVDGGSNYKGVPTIAVSDEQVGTGFSATGVLGVNAPVYGFLDTTSVTTGGNYTSGNTHSFDLSTAAPTIAYSLPPSSTTLSVPASFDPVSAQYTALIPLAATAPATGTGAFLQVKFNALSAAAKLGNVTVDYQGSQTEYTTAGTVIKFRAQRSGWYTTSNYFENTFVGVDTGLDSDLVYSAEANKDAFWGLMPNPGSYKFAKRQIWQRLYSQSGALGGSGVNTDSFGDYHFPDYDRVGYRLLTGPETGLATESNWEVNSAPVQRDGSGRPYIDIDLKPARNASNVARAVQANTVFPRIRVFLLDCPDEWTVESAGGAPLTPSSSVESWLARYHPMTGQDRRALFDDPTTNKTNSTPSGTMITYGIGSSFTSSQRTSLDTATRWWSQGHNFNPNNLASRRQARPIVDIRQAEGTLTAGITNGSIQVLSTGSGIERGTKFAVRFEQYNAADYRVTARNTSKTDYTNFSWATATDDAKFPPTRTIAVTSMPRKGAFGTSFTDLYFEANEADPAGTAPQNLLPGPVTGAPRVTVSGQGWTAANEEASVRLRQRATTGAATFSNSDLFTVKTSLITAAITGRRIGSVSIVSKGQNYFREPTILFRGGGGYGLKLQSTVSNGQVTAVTVIDGGDGFTSNTDLYTDVQPAKLLPVLRGTLRGVYRCAYRFADYSQTLVLNTTITTTANSTTATLGGAAGVAPDMQITGSALVQHLTRIASISGTTVTLANPAVSTGTSSCAIRDMTRPVQYSDFSPIVDVEATANGADRAAQMNWSLPSVTAPARSDFVEFFRTSGDQSLVFYRVGVFGSVADGQITISGSDTLSDEELFDVRRAGYAALPVVLPNGALNAFRFGNARTDMSVCVAWQDRLWYGVSTSGEDANTVFFSEYDEFESCPDINEIPIQNNLRSTDYLTALVPFGSTLLAMQSLHCYSLAYNTDPAIDAVVSLVAHRGVISARCWDIHDELLYAMDERGVYRMTATGEIEVLSDAVRDYFGDPKLDFGAKDSFFLTVDQTTGILRAFVSLAGENAQYPTLSLCYHIRNKAWWTESWPASITASGEYRAPGKRDATIYGTADRALVEMVGLRDISSRDIVSATITNGGSGYTSPPTVTVPGGVGAELRAVVRDGKVAEIIVHRPGSGYGSFDPNTDAFVPAVALTFSGGGGSGAAGTATARNPDTGGANPSRIRTTVPWRVRTPPLELAYEANTRGGDGQIDRSITVTYRPCETNTTLNVREYYNNSNNPRVNVMRRDRGTGFVHEQDSSRTTLNMAATRTSLGTATGLAQARFAGRSLDDLASADRHIALELSCDPVVAATEAEVSQPIVYALEVRGVKDGD